MGMRVTLFITVAFLAALAPAAQAGERVTLRNGFEMRCNHHAMVDGRTRLYLGAGEDNYIEFAPQEIAVFEIVPDPPQHCPPRCIRLQLCRQTGATQNSTRRICTRCSSKPAATTTSTWTCWPAW